MLLLCESESLVFFFRRNLLLGVLLLQLFVWSADGFLGGEGKRRGEQRRLKLVRAGLKIMGTGSVREKARRAGRGSKGGHRLQAPRMRSRGYGHRRGCYIEIQSAAKNCRMLLQAGEDRAVYDERVIAKRVVVLGAYGGCSYLLCANGSWKRMVDCLVDRRIAGCLRSWAVVAVWKSPSSRPYMGFSRVMPSKSMWPSRGRKTGYGAKPVMSSSNDAAAAWLKSHSVGVKIWLQLATGGCSLLWFCCLSVSVPTTELAHATLMQFLALKSL